MIFYLRARRPLRWSDDAHMLLWRIRRFICAASRYADVCKGGLSVPAVDNADLKYLLDFQSRTRGRRWDLEINTAHFYRFFQLGYGRELEISVRRNEIRYFADVSPDADWSMFRAAMILCFGATAADWTRADRIDPFDLISLRGLGLASVPQAQIISAGTLKKCRRRVMQ